MMNDNDDDAKSPVQAFLEEHQEKIYELRGESWLLFEDCYKPIIGQEKAEDYFLAMDKKIESMMTFSCIKDKIEELKKERGSCRDKYDAWLHRRSPDNKNELREKFAEFEHKISCIITTAEQNVEKLRKQAQNTYSIIVKECPFGEQENKVKNALIFQIKILELIEWLFVTELERIDLKKIEDGSQRRDGGYKALGEFNTKQRCGFSFTHLFIECKNYKKPSYHDLMQVFSYTLYCQESRIFSMPLSLLISRGNPYVESATWKLRSVIFNRRIEDEQRLILFLDEGDLRKMLDYKDPAYLLKEKIEEMNNWNIKRGAN